MPRACDRTDLPTTAPCRFRRTWQAAAPNAKTRNSLVFCRRRQRWATPRAAQTWRAGALSPRRAVARASKTLWRENTISCPDLRCGSCDPTSVGRTRLRRARTGKTPAKTRRATHTRAFSILSTRPRTLKTPVATSLLRTRPDRTWCRAQDPGTRSRRIFCRLLSPLSEDVCLTSLPRGRAGARVAPGFQDQTSFAADLVRPPQNYPCLVQSRPRAVSLVCMSSSAVTIARYAP